MQRLWKSKGSEFSLTHILTHTCSCTASLQLCSGKSVWLAVHEDGVSLLTHSSMEVCEVHGYDQLAAFGEDGDHLMLVTSSQPGSHSNSETEKLLLVMSKAKVCVCVHVRVHVCATKSTCGHALVSVIHS